MIKRILSNWILYFVAFFMFATMLVLLLVQMKGSPLEFIIAGSASVLAYSLMLAGTFLASRPRFLEKRIGMPKMYKIHALMTVYAVILMFTHIVIYWQGFANVFRNITTIAGYVGAFAILAGLLSGMLSLSTMFVGKNKFLKHLKEKVLNREVMLWVHRLGALVGIVAVYIQQVTISFIWANTPYVILLTTYTLLVLGYYAYWKITAVLGKRYTLSNIYKATPSLWVLEFKTTNGKIASYRPGDYFFIRFINANITKEGHPFSTSSAITKVYDDRIEFMIKEAGDWTKALKNVKVGDVATLEGPYGDFYPEVIEENEAPYVLMGGGIGLTPNLSILRSEIDKGTNRRIELIWALSYEHDMFMIDELESYKKVNPNFNYHVIFSNEEVEGYDYGFISTKFLEKAKVSELYETADFFICGPAIMMSSTKNVLLENGVSENNIRVDDFDF